ncbi:hypothetical protein GCM10022389_00170 [Flavobacterium cheonanense]|uniref:DUF4296 domain-containing protein n=1 Tax=Flavobacterium cheonanense TaxID=706183 RepID=A0ABP7V6S2_9FLAO
MRNLIIILTSTIVTSFSVCGQTKSNNIDNKQTIQNIKFVFDDYVKYQEATDSKADIDLMISSLKSLNKITNHNELEVLINVWMYYDPTDFQGIPEINRILKISRPESIEAVKKRMANKKEWENEESAPYSDLKNLLKQLENE